MQRLSAYSTTLALGLSAIMAGCSQHTVSSPLPAEPQSGAMTSTRPAQTSFSRHPAASGSESVLYTFKGLTDGGTPLAGLTVLDGTLYGTTAYGGKGSGQCNNYICGTVFKVSTSGAEQVLYRFKNTPDGQTPQAGLIAVNGTLYGTTFAGGGSGVGAVFAVSTSGKESVLHTFSGSPDGSDPLAGLIAVKGVLYGTTYTGGAVSGGSGTVFNVSTSGTESVLHSFAGGGYSNAPDGGNPQAGLVNLSGTLYGTTPDGGGTSCVEGDGTQGCGVVFGMSTSGNETVLYRFKGGKTGAYPSAGLISVKGVLYGTTAGGGDSGSGSGGCSGNPAFGCGTVFSVSMSGTQRALYRFKGGSDGWGPLAGLIAVKGTLYGTTANGGGSGCNGYGCGTVFEVSTTGEGYRVLHSFAGGSDGARPFAGLIHVNGTFYGTTSAGGGSSNCAFNGATGCGTVFAVTP
jgi:uncharacterized repeat protein (TIGR03803 family)